MGVNRLRLRWDQLFKVGLGFLKSEVIGQYSACETLAGVMASQLLRGENGTGAPSARCLVVGPTSSGKSHLAGNIVRWLQLPHAWVNVSLLTPPGYKGYDTNAALMQLVKANGKDDGQKIPSILVLDEIDKALRRARDSSWLQQLQYSLLPVLGGERINVTGDNNDMPDALYYTHNTLVVMMGVFPEIPTHIWRNEIKARSALVKYGFCEEFVSRLTHIIPLEKLGRDEIQTIVQREAKLVAKSYRSKTYTPSLSSKELNQLTDLTIKSPFGIRGSRLTLHRILAMKAVRDAEGR